MTAQAKLNRNGATRLHARWNLQILDAYLSDVCPHGAARLPANTFVLDREGMARVLSLPVTFRLFFVRLPAILSSAAGCAA